jgi:homoprotocatechuate degradation regulator HpaR
MPDDHSHFKHRNLPLALLHARERVMSQFRPILTAHGLTEQQWRIIRVLLDSSPLEPRDIGVRCRLSSPSLAGVLARMEDIGLISRKGVKHDQRRVLIALTPRSHTLAERLAPQIEAVYERIEGLLGTEFCDRFYKTLDTLIDKLDGPYPGRLPTNSAAGNF